MQLANQQLETRSSCFYCLLNGHVNCQDAVFLTHSHSDVEPNGNGFILQSVHLYFTQCSSAVWKLLLICVCALVAYCDGLVGCWAVIISSFPFVLNVFRCVILFCMRSMRKFKNDEMSETEFHGTVHVWIEKKTDDAAVKSDLWWLELIP